MKIYAAERLHASDIVSVHEAVTSLTKVQSFIAFHMGVSAPEGRSENTLALQTAMDYADKLQTILGLIYEDSLNHFQPESIKAAKRLLSIEDISPKEGDRIEILDDNVTDKAPASGKIIKAFITADGLYITAYLSDVEQTFSWEDLKDKARLKGDLWIIER